MLIACWLSQRIHTGIPPRAAGSSSEFQVFYSILPFSAFLFGKNGIANTKWKAYCTNTTHHEQQWLEL